MEDIVNLIASSTNSSDISDEIKNALYRKSSEKIDYVRPLVSHNMFGDSEDQE